MTLITEGEDYGRWQQGASCLEGFLLQLPHRHIPLQGSLLCVVVAEDSTKAEEKTAAFLSQTAVPRLPGACPQDCIQVSATTVKKGSQNYEGLENLTVVRQMSFCFSSLYSHSHLHHSQTFTITDPVITVFVPLVSERKFDRVMCKFLYILVNSHIYQN